MSRIHRLNYLMIALRSDSRLSFSDFFLLINTGEFKGWWTLPYVMPLAALGPRACSFSLFKDHCSIQIGLLVTHFNDRAVGTLISSGLSYKFGEPTLALACLWTA